MIYVGSAFCLMRSSVSRAYAYNPATSFAKSPKMSRAISVLQWVHGCKEVATCRGERNGRLYFCSIRRSSATSWSSIERACLSAWVRRVLVLRRVGFLLFMATSCFSKYGSSIPCPVPSLHACLVQRVAYYRLSPYSIIQRTIRRLIVAMIKSGKVLFIHRRSLVLNHYTEFRKAASNHERTQPTTLFRGR
jgi:hypothetical protein